MKRRFDMAATAAKEQFKQKIDMKSRTSDESDREKRHRERKKTSAEIA